MTSVVARVPPPATSEEVPEAVRRLRHRAASLRARAFSEMAASAASSLPHHAAAMKRRAVHLMRLATDASARAEELLAETGHPAPRGWTPDDTEPGGAR